ncbi:hypothetical protein FPV67DRAFT_1419974, partial [Lyophyllum atratum]
MRRTAKRVPTFKTTHHQAYSTEIRKLARLMVVGGCARGKVGALLCEIGNVFGVHVKKAMSRRTVSRTMLEGLIASKTQIAYEVSLSQGIADSTSNRGINFESCHIAMRAPEYGSQSLTVDDAAKPKLRLLCLDSTVDHTAATSVESIMKHVKDAIDVFNWSPTAERL